MPETFDPDHGDMSFAKGGFQGGSEDVYCSVRKELTDDENRQKAKDWARARGCKTIRWANGDEETL